MAGLVGGGVVLGACNGASADSGIVVRDSAGITIVENPAPSPDASAMWEVGDEPVLEIGELEGPEEYQLFRVSGVLKLPDGRVVLANAGTHELRFYDASGSHLASVGGRGGGPGEFEQMGGLHLTGRGDSLAVYDFRLRRLSVFDLDGVFARSFPVEAPGTGFPIVRAPFSDGTWLVSTGSMFGPGATSGASRDSVSFFRLDSDGAVLDTLGRFPGTEYFVRSSENRVTVTGLAFGRGEETAVAGDRFYFGNTDAYRIAEYTTTGQMTRIVRTAQRHLDVTADDIASYIERRLEDAGDASWRREQERMFESMPFPSTMPAFGRMQLDGAANLWVAVYRRPGDERPRWLVYDPDGRLVGPVETPPGLRIRQIGDDFILGTWRDEMDVEHVRMHRLHKPEHDR